jgi:hypothetical protein
MEINWEAKWNEYIKEACCSIAMSCPKCNIAASHCDCAKKRWIECEKEKLGLKKMFSCDFCGNKKTFVYQMWDQGLKSICQICVDKREPHGAN